MSQLGLIVKNEYITDVSSKSFWIVSIVLPLVVAIFSFVAGFMLSESDTAMGMQQSILPTPGADEDNPITGLKLLGLLLGMFLTIFIMMFGSQIFNKVKAEKTNRIVEIMATCVTGRTMMLAKIISVGLVGLTQMLVWAVLIGVAITGALMVFPLDLPWGALLAPKYIMALVWSMIYFFGGYIFFASMYAAAGAMSDKNNENQEYMVVLTFILLFSFYIGEYAVDHGSALFVRICGMLPFTSPSIGAVNAITQSAPLWETLLSVAILYVCAYASLAFSGKLYTSSILLKGKRLSPKDLITFLKAK